MQADAHKESRRKQNVKEGCKKLVVGVQGVKRHTTYFTHTQITLISLKPAVPHTLHTLVPSLNKNDAHSMQMYADVLALIKQGVSHTVHQRVIHKRLSFIHVCLSPLPPPC